MILYLFCEMKKFLSIEHHKTKNCLEEEIRRRAKTKSEIKSHNQLQSSQEADRQIYLQALYKCCEAITTQAKQLES